MQNRPIFNLGNLLGGGGKQFKGLHPLAEFEAGLLLHKNVHLDEIVLVRPSGEYEEFSAGKVSNLISQISKNIGKPNLMGAGNSAKGVDNPLAIYREFMEAVHAHLIQKSKAQPTQIKRFFVYDMRSSSSKTRKLESRVITLKQQLLQELSGTPVAKAWTPEHSAASTHFHPLTNQSKPAKSEPLPKLGGEISKEEMDAELFKTMIFNDSELEIARRYQPPTSSKKTKKSATDSGIARDLDLSSQKPDLYSRRTLRKIAENRNNGGYTGAADKTVAGSPAEDPNYTGPADQTIVANPMPAQRTAQSNDSKPTIQEDLRLRFRKLGQELAAKNLVGSNPYNHIYTLLIDESCEMPVINGSDEQTKTSAAMQVSKMVCHNEDFKKFHELNILQVQELAKNLLKIRNFHGNQYLEMMRDSISFLISPMKGKPLAKEYKERSLVSLFYQIATQPKTLSEDFRQVFVSMGLTLRYFNLILERSNKPGLLRVADLQLGSLLNNKETPSYSAQATIKMDAATLQQIRAKRKASSQPQSDENNHKNVSEFPGIEVPAKAAKVVDELAPLLPPKDPSLVDSQSNRDAFYRGLYMQIKRNNLIQVKEAIDGMQIKIKNFKRKNIGDSSDQNIFDKPVARVFEWARSVDSRYQINIDNLKRFVDKDECLQKAFENKSINELLDEVNNSRTSKNMPKELMRQSLVILVSNVMKHYQDYYGLKL